MALTIDGSDPTGDLGDLLASKLDLAGGKILQTVYAFTTTELSTTSTSKVDTGLTATITPSSNTSKVLILVNQIFYVFKSVDGIGMGLSLLRDSTVLLNDSNYQTGYVAAQELYGRAPLLVLDSPATTSAVTYKTQGAVNNNANSGRVDFQDNSLESTILLMEVSA